MTDPTITLLNRLLPFVGHRVTLVRNGQRAPPVYLIGVSLRGGNVWCDTASESWMARESDVLEQETIMTGFDVASLETRFNRIYAAYDEYNRLTDNATPNRRRITCNCTVCAAERNQVYPARTGRIDGVPIDDIGPPSSTSSQVGDGL